MSNIQPSNEYEFHWIGEKWYRIPTRVLTESLVEYDKKGTPGKIEISACGDLNLLRKAHYRTRNFKNPTINNS